MNLRRIAVSCSDPFLQERISAETLYAPTTALLVSRNAIAALDLKSIQAWGRGGGGVMIQRHFESALKIHRERSKRGLNRLILFLSSKRSSLTMISFNASSSVPFVNMASLKQSYNPGWPAQNMDVD